MAKTNRRKRIRICAHQSPSNLVHDMIIVHFNDTYVRPHKHLNKDETFHLIKGELDVKIENIINMGECKSGKTFFYRLSKSKFHTVIPKSDVVVFHETTKGPFHQNETEFPKWAPDEKNSEKAKNYINNLITNELDINL